MAYKVKRTGVIEDELVIEDISGNEVLKLPVKMYVDDTLAAYNRLRRILGEAQYEVQKDPKSEKAMTTLGLTIVELFKLIFGEEGIKKILDYYDDRYTEMLSDIAPFVVDRIQPKMNEAMKARAERFRAMQKQAGK